MPSTTGHPHLLSSARSAFLKEINCLPKAVLQYTAHAFATTFKLNIHNLLLCCAVVIQSHTCQRLDRNMIHDNTLQISSRASRKIYSIQYLTGLLHLLPTEASLHILKNATTHGCKNLGTFVRFLQHASGLPESADSRDSLYQVEEVH